MYDMNSMFNAQCKLIHDGDVFKTLKTDEFIPFSKYQYKILLIS